MIGFGNEPNWLVKCQIAMIAFAGYDDINRDYLIFCIHLDDQLMFIKIKFIIADYHGYRRGKAR